MPKMKRLPPVYVCPECGHVTGLTKCEVCLIWTVYYKVAIDYHRQLGRCLGCGVLDPAEGDDLCGPCLDRLEQEEDV